MKKKYLILTGLLFAWMGAQPVSAQTDVTSTYFANPSFETLKASDGTTDVTVKTTLTNGLYGWEVADMSNYQVESYESGSSTGFPADGSGKIAASDRTYYYFNRNGWGDKNSELKTTTTQSLPAGWYYLEFDYKAADYTNNNDASKNGTTVGVKILNVDASVLGENPLAKRAYSTTNGSNNPGTDNYMVAAEWTKMGVCFEVKEATAITVVIRQEMKNYGRSDIAYDNLRLYSLDGVTETNTVEMTGVIVNPSFATRSNLGWTFTPSGQLAISYEAGEFYEDDFDINQTITGLPNGVYEVKASAYYRTTGDDKASLYGNDANVAIKSLYDETIPEGLGGTYKDGFPDRMDAGSACFAAGYYVNTLDRALVTNGTLKLGISNTGHTGGSWCMFDKFRLVYKGFDTTAAKEKLNTMLKDAKAMAEANNSSAALLEELNAKITAAEAALEEGTAKVLDAATVDLQVAMDAYNALVEPMTWLKSWSVNSVSTKTDWATFEFELNKALAAAEKAMTVEEITKAINELEPARKVYVLVAQPKEGYGFDLTFKINNAAVASTDGWTNATTASGQQYDGAPDNTYLDRGWNGRLNATQVIANLPDGKYTLKAATRSYNPNESNIYVEHDGTTDRTTVHNDNNTGGELGNGWSWTEVPFTLASGDVKIGFYADCGNNQWAGADDFHITYAGVADASAAYEAQKQLAEAILSSVMGQDVKDAIRENLNKSVEGASRNELLQAMFDLKDAVSAAEASIAAYAYLQREVATAKSLGLDVATVESNIAAESYTTEAAIAEAQAQNVAVYNKVKENYAYEVPVEGWTGDFGTTTGQHWSGNANTSYYDTNGWNFNRSLATTVTLPAGEYVLMAAGRSASNTTMDLKIDDTTVRFTAKGDTGYGIDTKGQANFLESGMYANGGAGRGWEWEYVHLTLAEEKTVNLSATIASSASDMGWGSFSDITLKMDQATFEAVYYKRLQIALEECKPWNTDNTYADTTYPEYETAYTNKMYTTVEEIEMAITDLRVAFDAYALENANAEHPYDMTDNFIKFADCTANDMTVDGVKVGWLGDGRPTTSGQHWSGDANRVYFRQNHENGPARSQKITLNKVGAYLLKTSVRIVKPGAYATISVNDASETTNEVFGTTGGTIATDGTEWNSVEEGIAAGKTFANDNKGYGWVYNDVYFGAVSENDYEKTISINLSDCDSRNHEANCGGMKLYYIGKNYVNTKDGVAGYYGMFGEDPVALTDEVQAADVTQAAFTSLTLNRTNPNGLVYAKAGQLTETENVVVDGTCANLVLADGHPFTAPKAFTATKATYSMAAVATTADGKGFGTLCLPFEVTTLAGQAYKLDQGVTAGGELYATEVTTVPANTPVLVTAAGSYSAENASVAAVKATDLREGGELVGVYAPTQAPVGSYVLQKHTDKVAFYPVVNVRPTVKPFRAYIRPQGEAASYSMLSVVFGFDEETAIETVETAEGVKEVSRHDAAGVRISRPQKGLNIIRMSDGSVRKVIIK
jgi:hypothetical protein